MAVETPRDLFGGAASPSVSALLGAAMQSYADTGEAERLLWQAHRASPEALPVYFSLYKFYFYKGDLENAELGARMALLEAARQGGFNPDWHGLSRDTANWTHYEGPAHFYLFSLKALAFIRLRRRDAAEARAILAKLAEIDPADSVGASVIRSIAEGVV
jgi:tetratricopeptide (TPR) repeat protein